jgi:hypothetical protein
VIEIWLERRRDTHRARSCELLGIGSGQSDAPIEPIAGEAPKKWTLRLTRKLTVSSWSVGQGNKEKDATTRSNAAPLSSRCFAATGEMPAFL